MASAQPAPYPLVCSSTPNPSPSTRYPAMTGSVRAKAYWMVFTKTLPLFGQFTLPSIAHRPGTRQASRGSVGGFRGLLPVFAAQQRQHGRAAQRGGGQQRPQRRHGGVGRLRDDRG